MGARAEPELQTPRLLLRQWRPEDELAMAAVNADPEVTRYLNRPVGPAATRAFHQTAMAHWETHGFGFWAVESRERASEGRFLGFVGVAHPGFVPELAARVEIGWRLARQAWGRGLATEAAASARDHVFAALELPELISIIHPDNVRSQRVAEKLGMTISQHVFNPVMGIPVEVWRLPAPGLPGREDSCTESLSKPGGLAANP